LFQEKEANGNYRILTTVIVATQKSNHQCRSAAAAGSGYILNVPVSLFKITAPSTNVATNVMHVNNNAKIITYNRPNLMPL